MNFQHMPEVSWQHGYTMAAVVMVSSTALTYWYFKKKKWF
jgi:magnesium transporter